MKREVKKLMRREKVRLVIRRTLASGWLAMLVSIAYLATK